MAKRRISEIGVDYNFLGLVADNKQAKLKDELIVKSATEDEEEEEECILPNDINNGVIMNNNPTINVPPVAEQMKKGILDNRPGLVIAGPTNPLKPKRVRRLIPKKFRDEPLKLECEWQDCSFTTQVMDEFMDHVGAHVPLVEVTFKEDLSMTVHFSCNWKNCPWKTNKTEDLQRHLFLHAYHTKLKCIGLNTMQRSELNMCIADTSNRNILPDLSKDLSCAWGSCRQIFTNIQLYYNHIGDHVESTPRGKKVPGGIQCVWQGCAAFFPNAVKLRDHMRSHTQEKLLACPTCGGFFSNRTRFFDHCRRQISLEDLEAEGGFACDVCLKYFSTARLLRDHIRAHINTYKCHLCEMSCSSPSALNTHMRYKHSDDKPFVCSLCNYSCKTYNDLNRHCKIHGDVTYKCEEEQCDFMCKSLTSLKSHWSKTHGDGKSKYACHVCEKKFLKGYYLTRHLTATHNLQWPAGHSRFRYKLNDDGFFRLLTVRFESLDEQANAEVRVEVQGQLEPEEDDDPLG